MVFNNVFGLYFLIYIYFLIIFVFQIANSLECNNCINGKCIFENIENSTIDINKTPKSICQCYENWSGPKCDEFSCSGRLRIKEISGQIIDATGNYTINNKCTWIIGDGNNTYPIRLHIREFSSECGWDNLYIYDGSSLDAPLVAVLSGIITPEDIPYFPELTLKSGYGFLHFYSDAAYNMSGFAIDFWHSKCQNNCSNHGECLFNGSCSCQIGWIGLSCDQLICPNNCNNNGVCINSGCQCYSGYRGDDCSLAENVGYWEKISFNDGFVPEGSSSHSLLLIGDNFYVFGGYTFHSNDFLQIYKFNLKSKFWKHIPTTNAPQPRYGHSLNLYDKNQIIYMIGGVVDGNITNQVFSFSLKNFSWNEIISSDENSLLATSGHTSHIIQDVLFVFFGHNPVYGFLNYIQIFDLKKLTWSILKTSGATIKGTYGHTSVHDFESNVILVHGGYSSENGTAYYMADSLLSFNIELKVWKVLSSSGFNRYLHTACIIGRFMFVFGGNTHNDTSISQGAKCYSNNLLAYDIDCNQWHILDSPKPHLMASRYGHSAFVYADDLYIYGGYNGLLLNDLLKYSLGRCKGTEKDYCISPNRGTRCRFVDNFICMNQNEALEKLQYKNIQDYEQYNCIPKSSNICDSNILKTCTACAVNSEMCVWCGEACQLNKTGCKEFATSEESCLNLFESKSYNCVHLHNCEACNLDENCNWNVETGCKFLSNKEKSNRTCKHPACSTHKSCYNCTTNACMWCTNMEQCIESNSYVASFPYGICMEWKTNHQHCPASYCDYYHSCSSCLKNPSCGFCDDGSNTGIGECMIGDLLPIPSVQCTNANWNYATCPLCQCNGHSECIRNTSICLNCNDNTQGERCEYCKAGFYGNPVDGGNCTTCQCSAEDSCNTTGFCVCGTRGAIGKLCEECDKEHTYILNENGIGSCYYQLTINNIITFNLTKENISRMNFYNIPIARDKDVELNVNCTGGLSNISVVLRKANNENEIVHPNSFCTQFSYRFLSKDYTFGDNSNTTFFVHIHNMHIPSIIQLSFSQSDNLDLLKFFITFFSCFFSLLLIAFVAWKVKQRYDFYRRSQRHMQEMAEMARRPFSMVCVIVNPENDKEFMQNGISNIDVKQTLKKRKLKVNPIAVEPLGNAKAAVLTLLLRLPHADEEFSLPEQSGFILGSTLVSYGGYSRRSNVDMPKVSRNTKVNIDSNNILSIQTV